MFVCLPNYYANYYTSRSRHTSANSTSTVTKATISQLGKSMLSTAVVSKEMPKRIVDLDENPEFDTLGVNKTKNCDSNAMELDSKVIGMILTHCYRIIM